MSCPAGLYIFVSTAFYGYASTCYDTDPLSDVRVLCQGKTTNCTITFNDANFGGNPCSGHAVTKYGSATMYCIGKISGFIIFNSFHYIFSKTAIAKCSPHTVSVGRRALYLNTRARRIIFRNPYVTLPTFWHHWWGLRLLAEIAMWCINVRYMLGLYPLYVLSLCSFNINIHVLLSLITWHSSVKC